MKWGKRYLPSFFGGGGGGGGGGEEKKSKSVLDPS